MHRDLGRRLRQGVELEDGPVNVDSFQLVDTHAGQSVVEVVLHEGRKHIVRRLLAEVGLPVTRLTRTAIGPIDLRPDAHRHDPQADPLGGRRPARARRPLTDARPGVIGG